MAKKYQIIQKTGAETTETLHPETESSVVLLSSTIDATNTNLAAGKSVQTALAEIKGLADAAAKSASDLVGTDGLILSSKLPSYVDDVVEYSSASSFPTEGETGKIYVATDTNLTYRWSGSQYTEISASLALGSTSSTAFRGDYGTVVKNWVRDESDVVSSLLANVHSGSSSSTDAVTVDSLVMSEYSVEASAKSAFPSTGAAKTLYYATDEGKVYIYSNGAYTVCNQYSLTGEVANIAGMVRKIISGTYATPASKLATARQVIINGDATNLTPSAVDTSETGSYPTFDGSDNLTATINLKTKSNMATEIAAARTALSQSTRTITRPYSAVCYDSAGRAETLQQIVEVGGTTMPTDLCTGGIWFKEITE